jgi:hypothetical protein
VIGDAFSFKGAAFFQLYLSFIDQLLQERGMVNYLVIATQFGVFVL